MKTRPLGGWGWGEGLHLLYTVGCITASAAGEGRDPAQQTSSWWRTTSPPLLHLPLVHA